MDDSPLKEDVPVLTVPEVQPEEEKTETNARDWHIISGNKGLETVKPALPEVLQVSYGTELERPLMNSKICD